MKHCVAMVLLFFGKQYSSQDMSRHVFRPKPWTKHVDSACAALGLNNHISTCGGSRCLWSVWQDLPDLPSSAHAMTQHHLPAYGNMTCFPVFATKAANYGRLCQPMPAPYQKGQGGFATWLSCTSKSVQTFQYLPVEEVKIQIQPPKLSTPYGLNMF